MSVDTRRDTEAEVADDTGPLTDGIHLVVDALALNDVDTIYGVVGIPITDLARVAQASRIRYIGFRHESAAGHAAAAAGFLTKKPGICLTVSAPGFLNGLVALANATTNCFPMVQISGSSERHLDLVGAFMLVVVALCGAYFQDPPKNWWPADVDPATRGRQFGYQEPSEKPPCCSAVHTTGCH